MSDNEIPKSPLASCVTVSKRLKLLKLKIKESTPRTADIPDVIKSIIPLSNPPRNWSITQVTTFATFFNRSQTISLISPPRLSIMLAIKHGINFCNCFMGSIVAFCAATPAKCAPDALVGTAAAAISYTCATPCCRAGSNFS